MNKTLISLLLALGYPAHAEENILDAEAAIKNGAPLAAYQHLAPHPLYPYLEARYYRDNLATTPTATLVAFLQKYPNDPFSTTLAKQAYPYWAAGGENDAIIASYSPGYADEPLECQYRLALMSRGKTREAIKDSDKLLASDKSLSAEPHKPGWTSTRTACPSKAPTASPTLTGAAPYSPNNWANA